MREMYRNLINHKKSQPKNIHTVCRSIHDFWLLIISVCRVYGEFFMPFKNVSNFQDHVKQKKRMQRVFEILSEK